MNKKLIAALAATTMAGAIGFASVAAAEATFYGRVVAGAVYNDQDTDEDDGAWNLGATDVDGSGNAHSRFGFKGSTELGNGMNAGFKIERELRGDSTISQRHNLVYLSGGWGKLTLGNQSNPYMNARNWDQTNLFGGEFGASYRHEGVGYSMSTGPFSLNIMALANDANGDLSGSVPAGTCASFRLDTACGTDALITVAGEVSGNDGVDGWIIHAGYDFGPVAVNFAHHADNQDAESNVAVTTDANTSAEQAAAQTVATAIGSALADLYASRDRTAIGINGSVGPLDWYLAYETSELNASGNYEDNDIDSVGGFLGFNVSEKDILYAYYVSHSADRISANATLDDDDDLTGEIEVSFRGEDYTETILGYSHSFGPGVKFIAEYAKFDSDLEKDGEPNKIFLGIKYDF